MQYYTGHNSPPPLAQTKPLMQPIRQDKLKKMAAIITNTNVWPADLFKMQFKKNKRAKIQKVFEK